MTPSPLPFVRIAVGIIAEAVFLSTSAWGRSCCRASRETGDMEDAPDVVPVAEFEGELATNAALASRIAMEVGN